MSFIRHFQRAITAVFPQPANRSYIVPKRLQAVVVLAPLWETFGAALPNQSDTVNVPITPLDSAFFLAEGTPPIVFEDIGAQLPTGLALDVNTGFITGTPTVIAGAALISERATNDEGQDITSYTWTITA